MCTLQGDTNSYPQESSTAIRSTPALLHVLFIMYPTYSSPPALRLPPLLFPCFFSSQVVERVRTNHADAFHTAHLEVPGEMFRLAMEAQIQVCFGFGSRSALPRVVVKTEGKPSCVTCTNETRACPMHTNPKWCLFLKLVHAPCPKPCPWVLSCRL